MTVLSSTRVWAATAAVGASLLVVPGVAAADPLPAGCTQPESAGPVTCVYTSGSNELVLPKGVTSVTVTAVGGRGGNMDDSGAISAGGRGAEVTGTVTVPSGTRSLFAVVGGNGESTMYGPSLTGGVGGANGGGNGGTLNAVAGFPIPGAGGGGASDVRTTAGDLATRLVVAAGGGGAAAFSPGGDAGAPGQERANFTAAKPGSGTAGGSGGVFATEAKFNGTDGALGVGGVGAPHDYTGANTGGGGGGGGLYGGGGGSVFGSGAGGSSLAPAGTTVAWSDAAPSVTITYQPPTVTPPQPPVCTGSACLPAGLFGSS